MIPKKGPSHPDRHSIVSFEFSRSGQAYPFDVCNFLFEKTHGISSEKYGLPL